MTGPDDRAYQAMVAQERPVLEATAFLIVGDQDRAQRLVAFVLAQLYTRWASVQRPRTEALAAVLRAEGAEVQLPWESGNRFQLVDNLPVAQEAGIVADLRLLTHDQRLIIVLERVAELPSVQIAELVGRPVDEVLVLAQQAQAALAAGHPQRRSDPELAHELRAAVPVDQGPERPSDLAHGHTLVRRRSIRRALTAIGALVLVVLAISYLLPQRSPAPVAAHAPSAEPTPGVSVSVPVRCDTSTAPCRGHILYQWRSDMAEVARSALDPAGEYFTGFGYTGGQTYEVPGFWSGAGGALAFEMFRVEGGGTRLYVQLATSQDYALRCGASTGHRCFSMEFMDGNRFTVTETTTADKGVEIQYRPYDDQVITIVARDVGPGRKLALNTGDLLRLAGDPRLRLPRF
jgi:hypothetical protein